MADLNHGRGWLNPGPAASIHRIDREIGHPLQITEAGRSWAQQKAHWDTYQRRGYPIALHPDGPPKGNGPSVHQKGAAVDTDEGKRIVRVMEDHGWRRTVYRWVKGVWTLIEDWHWEYFENLDNHRFDAEPASTTPTIPEVDEEEDEDVKIKFGHRNEEGYGDEWMIVHPSFKGGLITTTDENRAKAWARLYKNGWAKLAVGDKGRYDFDVAREDYLEIQNAAKEAATAWQS